MNNNLRPDGREDAIRDSTDSLEARCSVRLCPEHNSAGIEFKTDEAARPTGCASFG
jgi:hypothetical protein